ncbi:MAG: tRNA (guanosine(37)-N1)-methyltransferase TrmD [Deltaproteobacteria bacterium]|nr:tRNA (guanosine(37)-N1)-methyltransferase TrmD [Deltaproteobacteria bacterium]
MIDIRVLTIFPNIFDSFLMYGNPARAIQMGLVKIQAVDLRQFADDPRRTTDDYPYGGGIGMVMKPDPIVRGIRSVQGSTNEVQVILLTPQGRQLTQQIVEELSSKASLLLICGRYEGIDERVRYFVHDEISVGDYVLSGGETASMVLMDAIVRLIPGVLGSDSRIDGESFYNGLLEYPQYTRPREFEGYEVPSVLLEGHHEKIRRWRRKMSLKRTTKHRPDLIRSMTIDNEVKELLQEIESESLI